MSTNRNPGINVSSNSTSISNIGSPTVNPAGWINVTSPGVGVTTVNSGSGYTGHTYSSGASGSSSWSLTGNPQVSPDAIVIKNAKGEIVRIDAEGKVTWADEKYAIDEAAVAFSKTFKVGLELSIGINESVKREMRDIIFQELIDIAKEEGPLDANQLHYMHRSAKIIDKLKGKF